MGRTHRARERKGTRGRAKAAGGKLLRRCCGIHSPQAHQRGGKVVAERLHQRLVDKHDEHRGRHVACPGARVVQQLGASGGGTAARRCCRRHGCALLLAVATAPMLGCGWDLQSRRQGSGHERGGSQASGWRRRRRRRERRQLGWQLLHRGAQSPAIGGGGPARSLACRQRLQAAPAPLPQLDLPLLASRPGGARRVCSRWPRGARGCGSGQLPGAGCGCGQVALRAAPGSRKARKLLRCAGGVQCQREPNTGRRLGAAEQPSAASTRCGCRSMPPVGPSHLAPPPLPGRPAGACRCQITWRAVVAG